MDSYDSLPYIDPAITETDRERAQALINQELPRTRGSHPSLAPAYEPQFSDLISQELERIRAGKSREGGIDLSRYEASEEPQDHSDIAAWKANLRTAYANHTYLEGRETNITLLEEFGKNAWLIGNSQLEEMLRSLEAELAMAKTRTEQVNRERKTAQEEAKGELQGLESTWRRGIGNVLETQVATYELQQQLDQVRKGGKR